MERIQGLREELMRLERIFNEDKYYIINDIGDYINVSSLFRERDILDEIETDLITRGNNYNLLVMNELNNRIVQINILLDEILMNNRGILLRRNIRVMQYLYNKCIYKIEYN